MKSTNQPIQNTPPSKLHYVGLDVHKDSNLVSVAIQGENDVHYYGKWGGTNLAVERGLNKLCKRFAVSKDQLRICYEAGPTGFVLARRLLQLKYHVIVVAPSHDP